MGLFNKLKNIFNNKKEEEKTSEEVKKYRRSLVIRNRFIFNIYNTKT